MPWPVTAITDISLVVVRNVPTRRGQEKDFPQEDLPTTFPLLLPDAVLEAAMNDTPKRGLRSDLICDALKTVPNPYLLCHATVKATRKFHRQGTLIQGTMNAVLARFAKIQSPEKVVRPSEQSTEATDTAA